MGKGTGDLPTGLESLVNCSHHGQTTKIPARPRYIIADLDKRGLRPVEIIKYLRFKGWKGKPTTIYRLLHNNRSGLFNGKPNIGTTASFTAEHEQVKEEVLRYIPKAVAADLQRVIETVTGRKFSLSTVRRHRRRLGWICTKH